MTTLTGLPPANFAAKEALNSSLFCFYSPDEIDFLILLFFLASASSFFFYIANSNGFIFLAYGLSSFFT